MSKRMCTSQFSASTSQNVEQSLSTSANHRHSTLKASGDAVLSACNEKPWRQRAGDIRRIVPRSLRWRVHLSQDDKTCTVAFLSRSPQKIHLGNTATDLRPSRCLSTRCPHLNRHQERIFVRVDTGSSSSRQRSTAAPGECTNWL